MPKYGRHKTIPVTPEGGFRDYQDDRLGRPTDTLDYDQAVEGPMGMDGGEPLEVRFADGACMYDGVSGKEVIDTLFENTVETIADSPRSAMGERPYRAGRAPAMADGVSLDRYGATKPNHEGVDNPASVDQKKHMYPQRRY